MKDNEENGGEEQDNPTLFDIVRKNPTMTYNEATKVQEDIRLERDAKKGEGFEKEIDYHRYWKNMYEKEHKLRQEAQGETTIVKGIGMNSPEMKTLKSEVGALKQQLHTDRDKAQARIKELEEILRSRDYTKQHDYKFLVDENKILGAKETHTIVISTHEEVAKMGKPFKLL